MWEFLKFSFFSILWPSKISNLVWNCNFCNFRQNLKFRTTVKVKRSKFQIFPHNFFASPWYLPIWTNLAQSDSQFSQIWSVYATNYHFSAKGDFPYILKYRPRISACKTKSFNNWETCDPILERRKIGLKHISK